MALTYTYEDEKKFKELAWKWARAYDTMDWELLASICAPKVRYHYQRLHSSFTNETITKEEFVSRTSAPNRLGDKDVRTQHLLGGAHFVMLDDGLATGEWQIKAAHLREATAESKRGVWDSYAYTKHYYEKVDGQWMFGGIEPTIILMDYEGGFDQVFR